MIAISGIVFKLHPPLISARGKRFYSSKVSGPALEPIHTPTEWVHGFFTWDKTSEV
jgi:hypothetical protein